MPTLATLRRRWRRFTGRARQNAKDSARYPLLRHIYRRTVPAARRERAMMRRFFGQLVEPGTLCFDIGANVGQTTEALLACGARVVAVEPNPRCRDVLAWQFGSDRRVVLRSAAVGANAGEAILHVSGTASTASLRSDWPFSTSESHRVALVTLDSLIAEYGRPMLVNIDVEGVELDVVRGLSTPVPILCYEARPGELQRATEVLRTLAGIGAIDGVNLVSWKNYDRWLLDRWARPPEAYRVLERNLVSLSDVVVRMSAAPR